MTDQSSETTILLTSHGRPRALDRFLCSYKKWAPDYHLIVADNSSRPPTDVCERHGVNLLKHRGNGGLGQLRNFLADRCETKYAVTIEDDLYFNRNTKLSVLIHSLEELNLDVSSGNVRNVDRQSAYFFGCLRLRGNKLVKIDRYIERLSIITGEEFYVANLTNTFVAARSKFLRRHRWFELPQVTGDICWYYKLWRAGTRVAFTPDVCILHSHDLDDDWYRNERYDRKKNRNANMAAWKAVCLRHGRIKTNAAFPKKRMIK